MDNDDFLRFIRPEKVAVIGASRTHGAVGNAVIKNFKDMGFRGKVFAINPKYEEVEGFPCYKSVLDIEDNIDVALIAVAKDMVEAAVQQCVEKKVRFIVIFSSGFAETGAKGREMQEKILALCRQNGIRVLGPNTMGAYNLKDRVLLTFSPADSTDLLYGEAGMVSQSGATGGMLLNLAAEEQVGLTYVLTTGNQVDLTVEDFLEFLVDDEDTKMIAVYMESIVNGDKLKNACARALSRHKPVVILKSGSSVAGQRAALSHTASIAGSCAVLDAVAKQYGMILVNELEDMVDALKAFKSGKRPEGNRVATLVISGAVGIMLADRLTEYGLEMAVLKEATKRRLAEVIPDYCSLANPVDIGSTLLKTPALFRHCLDVLTAADEVDILIVHLPVGVGMGGLKFARDIVDAASATKKPVIVVTTGTEKATGEIRTFLNQQNVPSYRYLKSAVKGAYYLLSYEKVYGKWQRQDFLNYQKKEAAVKLYTANASLLTEPEVKLLLSKNGIPVPRGGVEENLNELLKLARGLRYPLVAKVVSPDIAHKSPAGGVVLPVNSDAELAGAYHAIIANVRKHAPTATIRGIMLEELVQGPFLEVIISVKRDPVFGPVVLCGLGGIYVEIIKDTACRLAPVSASDALEMIHQLKSYPLFTAAKNGHSFDVTKLAEAISRLSHLAVSMEGSWEALEINPLAVLPEGQGVVALDGLITFPEQN